MPYSASGSDVPSYVPKARKKQWAAVWNSAYGRSKKDGSSDKDAEAAAFRQANGVAGPNASNKFAALMEKATTTEAKEFADAVTEAIESYWETLSPLVRPGLANAMLSGIGAGMLQIDVNDAKMLASANESAQKYASDRAAELVGMKYNEEGELVENPNAKWAISDTTRERLNEIITEAFAEETPLQQVKEEIQQALEAEAEGGGIFSMARAELIARTEISHAQAGGNFLVWKQSGVVKTLRWTTSEDESVCEECDGNDGVVVKIGQPFPSGDLFPGAHPRCRCVVVVQEASYT
jgi:SPP1 gp7 family putative phage head morphogenesis protein